MWATPIIFRLCYKLLKIMDYKTLTQQSDHNAAIEREEYNLFATIKPKLYKDGNQWCCLYGEDLQVGIAGFGDTPWFAIMDWNKGWRKL